jgi:hypothetical protein
LKSRMLEEQNACRKALKKRVEEEPLKESAQ